MPAATLPSNEVARLEELLSYRVLDTVPEQQYEDITFIASHICEAPIALVSLVDRDRQWFKSTVGLDDGQTSRDVSFCAHAIHQPTEVMEVPDATLDPRFAENELVTGSHHIRFYAGAPLVSPRGLALGTLCVLDRVPRTLSDEQKRALQSLARQVVTQMELRKTLSELELAYDKIAKQSVTDGLTGLSNRREFDNRMTEEVQRCRRSGNPLSFALIDIDHFKAFNDTHGHQAGDEELRRVAMVLHKSARAVDIAARYGGEEFVMVMPDTSNVGAMTFAERIREAIEAAPGEFEPSTVSIGVATATAGSADVESLIGAADTALYEAKEAGRNRVVAGEP